MPDQTPPSGKKWRILCIDDDPDVLAILQITLSTKHEIVKASDGVEGMCMLDISEPDFIICDVRMPNMDGFQTVSAIRRHPKFHDIPVFFLTAERDRSSAKRGFASGANLYLTKPFEPLRVLQNIDFFLKEHGSQPAPKRLTIAGVAEEMKRLSSQPSEPAGAAAPPDPSTVRVTIVSHAIEQVEMIQSALEGRFECIACAEPLSSIQRLFRYDPDILIVNPAIPRLSGLGFVQMLRQNPKLRRLAILLIQDQYQKFDPRLVPSITKFPLLPPNLTGADALAAVQGVINSGTFRPCEKRASIEKLQAEENELRRTQSAEKARRERQDERTRLRYSRIQHFIDKNML